MRFEPAISPRGTVLVNGGEVAREAQMVMFDRADGDVSLEANSDATALLLSGKPIDGPVVGYGPSVMNSQEEIRQAPHDDQLLGGRRIPQGG